MKNNLTRHTIGNQIHFNVISDCKFKYNRISVNIIIPLDKESAASYAVLPYVLKKGYKECPDFTTFHKKLSFLYGASLEADISKIGSMQCIELSIHAIDNRFTLQNEDMIQECASILVGIITNPNITNDCFDEKNVALEKQNNIDNIESEINDKRSYAVNQCLALMCKGEKHAIKKYGTIADVEKITPTSLVQSYHKLIATARIEIVFTGSGEPTFAKTCFEQAFAKINRTPSVFENEPTKNKADAVQEKVEITDVNQGKLVLGYRMGTCDSYKELTATRIMVTLFGASPFSRLFLNVREKLSLCYYCAARYDRFTNLMLVDSGVESENKQKALDEIGLQLKELQDGKITDTELDDTKMIIKNSLKSIGDSLSSMENWYMTQIMYGTNYTPYQDIQVIDTLSKQDIIDAAKKVTLDTVYFLTNK